MPHAPLQSDETLLLSDGRTLGYSICGYSPSPNTPVIFYAHGFPGSRLEGLLWLGGDNSPQLNARCISIERPGLGLSTFQPNRRILDFPRDVLALADHLKVDKFHVLALSGGGPYALACSKEIPKSRLLSTMVVSGLYSPDLSRAGMLWSARAILFMGYWVPTSIMAYLFDWKIGKLARDPDTKVIEDLMLKHMASRPKKDMECFEVDEFRETMVKSVVEAFKQGGMGMAWECRLYGDNWGFDLKELDGTNITLWHRTADVDTPYGMAEAASKLIKGCDFKGFEEETHTSSPFSHAEAILKHLLNLEA